MGTIIDFILEAQGNEVLAKRFVQLLEKGIESELSDFFINETRNLGASGTYNISSIESQKIITAYKRGKKKISDNIEGAIGPMAY